MINKGSCAALLSAAEDCNYISTLPTLRTTYNAWSHPRLHMHELGSITVTTAGILGYVSVVPGIVVILVLM